jgi:GAF domain-containing protein
MHAAMALFRADGAGVMVVDDDHVLRSVASTDHVGAALERAQAELGHGPCVDALTYGEVVTTGDVNDDERWPRLGAVLQADVRAVLGVPLHLAGGPVGSLNVYCRSSRDWSADEQQALNAYGGLMGRLVTTSLRGEEQGALIDQLQRALDSRATIERAVGLIMGRESVDAVTAFERLRREARSRRERVVAVAQELLDEVR